jgi:hypothetical protein
MYVVARYVCSSTGHRHSVARQQQPVVVGGVYKYCTSAVLHLYSMFFGARPLIAVAAMMLNQAPRGQMRRVQQYKPPYVNRSLQKKYRCRSTVQVPGSCSSHSSQLSRNEVKEHTFGTTVYSDNNTHKEADN